MVLAFLIVFVPSTFAQTITDTPPPAPTPCVTNGPLTPQPSCAIQVNQQDLGFRIPSLSEVLTFAIRAFFIIAGLVALVFLLLGALAWITSGGDKESVSKAQSKITSAIIGVILIVVVLAIIVTLEQVVFAGRLCLGLSCPITIPSLLQPPGSVPGSSQGSLNSISGETSTTTTTTTTSTSSGQINNYNVVTVTPGQEIIPHTGH